MSLGKKPLTFVFFIVIAAKNCLPHAVRKHNSTFMAAIAQKIVTSIIQKSIFYYYFAHSQVESVLLGAHCSSTYNNHIKIHLSLNINMFWNSLTIIIIIIIVSFIHLFWMAFIIAKRKKKKIIKMATLWIYIGFRE